VVATIVLSSSSMICFPLSGSYSDSEPASDLENFTSATSDCFEQKLAMLSSVMPGDLMEVTPLVGIFLDF
jgi:hypothetical protein